MSKLIIITDLDGTLLDSGTYSFKEARPALQLIRQMQIPLIFCSSKTRAELEVYRNKLKNQHPFISENGGGIFIPKHYFSFPIEAQNYRGYKLIALGKSYAEIRKHFILLRKTTGIKVQGFADMGIREIAELTNLPLKEVPYARKRDFDEPFIFRQKYDVRFLRAINETGMQWSEGRLFHIMGNHDKGKAIKILKTFYRKEYGTLQIIGIGDSLNDLSMLKIVDRAILIRREDGKYDQRIKLPNLMKSKLAGTAGWNETVLSLIEEMLPVHT